MAEGDTSLESNDLTTAEKRYGYALELRPESHEALAGLATALLHRRPPGSAVGTRAG